MKRLLIAASLLILASGAKAQTYNIVAGTNSISVAGVRYPLNHIALKIWSDSIHVALYSMSSMWTGYGDPIIKRDSFSHFKNAGTAFTSVSQLDSFYQAKFVK